MRLRVEAARRRASVALVLVAVRALLLAATASLAPAVASMAASAPVARRMNRRRPARRRAWCRHAGVYHYSSAFLGWRLAVGLAVLPVFPALLIASNTVLAPTNTIVPPQPAKGTQPAVPYPTSHFGSPFWLDPARLTPLLFSLAFFALLGWLGWVIGSFFRDA
jgi:hypothetical protein